MKKKSKLSQIVPLILALVLLVATFTVIITSVSAAEEIEVVGAMSTIKDNFDEKYLAQSTVRADDKYVGKVQYTVYYDTSRGQVKTGIEGTPIILYSINHPAIERIGTDSDVTIIQSMLDRGYVVMVLDYLNNPNADSTSTASSAQVFRQYLRSGVGNLLSNRTYFPSGTYQENYLAPAGCNVSLFNVFWEIDKHSAEGTLEKIVENWNSDFRATKGGKLLKWATGNTVDTRKAVQNDLDGNAPTWYDANGKEDANGLYTYVKYTKAEKITDCVDPDGSFLDMNLYIHIVYPTSPEKEVPVMALANSTGYPTTTTGTDSAYLRQHSNGFLYNGYANVVFDYLWQPMARSASWGYYDGSQGNTADHMNYGLMMYNDKLVNTAAMRYIRYTSLTGGDTYNFDLDKFGVYGNSKGGWFSFLGEKILQTELADATKYTSTAALEEAINTVLSDFISDRYYNGHHGETRYQMNRTTYTENGVTINGGEKQPWLTYNGKEILSGAQLTNACNGSQEEDITAGHSPIFISGNMTDDYNAAYSYSVNIYNMCRELNIPLLHFEVPIGHTLTEGQDMNYNVDTYEAYFTYVNYYLQNAPISVSHVSPMNNAGNVSVTDKITLYFAGAVTETEIAKVTVTSAGGTVNGVWESSFGGTTWTFTPEKLEGSTLYTVNVPADLKGDNGVAMGTDYTTSFLTEMDTATATNMSGSYHSISIPAFTNGNSFVFRFFVANDAVNVAELYAVSSVGETTGTYLGSVKVNGSGIYEIDVTDYAAANAGKDAVLYLKTAKAAGENNVFVKDGKEYDPFDTYTRSNTSQITANAGVSIDGETAFKVAITGPVNKNNISYYYDNVTSVFTYSNIVGSNNVTSNEGKRFVISFDVYDTVSRKLQLKLNTMTNRTGYGTIDYDHIIFTVDTKANEWTHVEFTYDVYETKYGFASDGKNQSLAFLLSPDGDLKSPAYFNNLKSLEITTDLDVKYSVIAEKNDGTGMPYTPAASTSPFAIYNGAEKIGEYAGWKAALAAYKSGYTIKLQSDYTFTDSDITNVIGSFAVVNVDLGNYTITSENTKNSLLYASATNANDTIVNVSGGAILLNKTPLVSYESSTAAGNGKTVNVNLNGTYIGLTDNAYLTAVISANTAPAGIVIKSNIALNDCVVDLPDANHARDGFAVFPNPTLSTLKVNYSVTGGEFRLTSQRWATISENANIVEFNKDSDGSYTVLVMPLSNTYDVSGSYLNDEGYAVYKNSSVADNMVTYVLETGANSTRYGVITETYMDKTAYPFLLFMNGNLVGGYDNYKAAVDAAATKLNGTAFVDSEAQIYVRANFKTDKEVSLGSSAGTIVVDLNGYTMLRDKNPASMVVNANAVFGYATGLLHKNGRIEMNHSYNSSTGKYSAGLLGATHVLKEVTEVKTFNVTYENITFGFADEYYAALNSNGLLWSVWQNSYKSETITNLTLTDCVFDFTKNAPAGKNLITANGTYADFNIEINGGEIKGDASAYSLVITDAEDKFTLGKNAKGEYIKLASGATPTTDNFLCDDGIYRSFQLENGSYVFKENTLSTKYGLIPEANGNDIFVLFSDGKFVSGHNTWSAATKAAGDLLNGNTNKKAQLLMRKDHNTANDACNSAALGKCNGELTIDLGNNILTRNTTKGLAFDFSYNNGNTAPANVIIKNGTILSCGKPIFANQVGTGGTADTKVWNITIEDIIIGYTASPSNTVENIWASWTNPTKVDGAVDKSSIIHGSQTNVTFNNCIFDLKTVAPASGSTLFDFSDNNGYDLMKTNLTIKGGKILANNLSDVTLFSVNSDTSDKVTFAKGDDGKYITMTTPTTAKDFSHYVKPFNTPEGTRYLVEVADDGTNSSYELLPMSFGGLNATITAKYLSTVDYPFFVFLGNTFKSANTTWRAAVDGAESYVNEASEASNVATIILRYDYDVIKLKPDGSNRDAQTNFNDARGKIVVNLNGYTLNAADTYIFDINPTYKADATYLGFASSVEFINGTIKNSRPSNLPAIGFQHSGNTAADDTKIFNLTFTNVTFAFGSSAAKVMTDEFPDKTGDGLIVNYTLNNCTIDLTGAASGTVVFDLKDNKTTMISTLKINGGKIIAYNIANYSIYTQNSNDTVIFGTVDGNYVTLTQLSESAAPTLIFKNESGTSLSFGKDVTDGVYTTYKVGEPIYTPYGYIPFMYQSVEDYPFVAFDEKGNFIKASAFLYGPNDEANSVMGRAKEYIKANVWDGSSYGASPKAVYIIMRRDYNMASNETFNNLAQVQGVITIDLNGYTLTAHNDKPIFPATVKPWSGSGDKPVFLTQFDVINGEIVVGKSPIIKFGAWDASGNDVSYKDFVFNFNNVTFTATSNMTNMFFSYYQDANTPEADASPNVVFNNCTFDLMNAKSGIVLFDLGNGYIHTSVTVNGGEILAKGNDFVMFTKNTATTSNLIFTKSENGNYMALTLPKAIAAPTGEYDIAGGKAVFVKVYENAGKITYRLRNSETVGIEYAPKMSITLANSFIMNVYVPTDYTQEFTFGGITYNSANNYGGVIETIDGETYYLVTVALGSSEAGKDIKLVSKVVSGDVSATATFTFSVPKYAAKLLDDADATDVEKTLVRDVLAYIKAAYNYAGFSADNTAEEIARVNTLIESIIGDYVGTPTTSGASADNNGGAVSGVTLNLDATPSIRFYTNDTSLAFYANGVKLNTVSGTDSNGTYVELDVYAYVLCETITFGNGGSYHISSFVKGAGENEKALASAFVKYVESASDYRKSVIAAD